MNKEDEELKECTFKPQVKTAETKTRSKEEFLQSQ